MVVEKEDAGSGEEEEDGAQLWVKSVTTRYSVVTGVPATTHSSPVQSQHQNNKPEQVLEKKKFRPLLEDKKKSITSHRKIIYTLLFHKKLKLNNIVTQSVGRDKSWNLGTNVMKQLKAIRFYF